MNIAWGNLGLVAVTTIVAAVVVVGIYSLGLASLTAADGHEAAGRPTGAARAIGYACLGVAGIVVLFGLYLIIPQFH